MASTTETATRTKSFAALKSPLIGGSVRAELSFYDPPAGGAKPFNYVEQPPEGVPQRNFGAKNVEVVVNDIRGREQQFTLDRDAFQAISNVESAETEWADDDHIKSTYYPECERLILQTVPGARKVIFFDYTIRRSNPDAPRAPVMRVHVDQTAKSAEERVRLHASSPEEAEELLHGRFRIINIWRPINGTVEAHPLGFASAASVDAARDLVPVEHRYPHRTGETAQVNYDERQEWYYWSQMGNEDRLLLKCWDTQESVGKCVPHTAFVDPNTPAGAKGRESIEVRTLVFG